MSTILTSVRNGARIIKFNKPAKKNAVSVTEFQLLKNVLQDDAKSNDTKLSIITGEGDFFTSGNDMTATLNAVLNKDEAYFLNFTKTFRSMAEELINYPKLLVSVVNGPAVGLGVTILGFCDLTYASTRSYFHMPFVNLGLNAEACATYTLPKIIGNHLYTEMVFGGKKIDVDEARRHKLVGSVFKHEDIEDVYKQLEVYGSLPLETLKRNKILMTENTKKELLECNKRETDALLNSLMSDEFRDSVKKFFDRKKK